MKDSREENLPIWARVLLSQEQHLAYRLAQVICRADDQRRWTIVNDLPEAFAGIRDDGKTVISWRGENYTRQRLSLRVRLHNWLCRIGDRK